MFDLLACFVGVGVAFKLSNLTPLVAYVGFYSYYPKLNEQFTQ